MTTYDLNNPLLVAASLSGSWIDLQLPRDLLHQMKGETKTPSLTLKDVHLAPPKPEDLKIRGNFDFTLFIGVNFDTSFTPAQFVKSFNEAFNKFIPKHPLFTLQDSRLQLNLMKGQRLFTPNSDLMRWLAPDNVDLLKNDKVPTQFFRSCNITTAIVVVSGGHPSILDLCWRCKRSHHQRGSEYLVDAQGPHGFPTPDRQCRRNPLPVPGGSQ